MSNFESAEVGKPGDVAPKGAGIGWWFFPIYLPAVSDADVVTTFTPGIPGKILALDCLVKVPVTTAAKLTTLNAEINAVNLTGGTVALTSANCTPLGAIVAGAAVTAANEFDEDDTISIEASSTTTFIEGEVVLIVTYQALAK